MMLLFLLVSASETLWMKSGKALVCERFQNQDGLVIIHRNAMMFSIKANLVDWRKTAEGPDLEVRNKEPVGDEITVEDLSPRPKPLTDMMIDKLDVKDAGAIDLMRFLADMAGINLVIDGSVSDTKATYFFENIPWQTAWDIVLMNAGLDSERIPHGYSVR